MGNVSRRPIDTAQWNGPCLFVHFDFEFFPMRVHSGHGLIKWEGREWQGIGDVLRRDASSNWSILSSHSSERGRISASLPMSKEMQEVLAEEYYRDRTMEWMICAVDENGDVERRVYVNRGNIIAFSRMEDSVTFTAQCGFLESLRQRDARHKRRVGSIRQRFKWGLADVIKSGAIGWIVSLAEILTGAMGFAVDVLAAVFPGRNRRIAKQRWSARRRTYWFKTEPRIPGIRMRRDGYRVRADTLEEAKSRLYDLVAKKIWDISPSVINMVIYSKDCPLEFLNLDKIRQNDDARRYEATSTARAWPP